MFDSNNNKTYYDLHVEDPILTIDEAIQKQNDNNQIDESFIKRVDDNVIEKLDKSNSIDDVVDDSNQSNIQPVNEENQVSEQQLQNNNTMNNVINHDKILNENVSQFEEVNKTKLKNKQIKQTKQSTSSVKTVQNQNEKITQNDIKHKDSIINLDVNKNNIVEGKRIRKLNTSIYNKDFVNATKDDSNINIKKALREMPETAKESVSKELKQIVEMKAVRPIILKKLSQIQILLTRKFYIQKHF